MSAARRNKRCFSRSLRFRYPLRFPMSSDKQTSDQRDEPPSLETDIARLASLITPTSKATSANGDRTVEPEIADGEELGIEEVEELIRRIEAANGIADGVEDKLDGILEHLDGLLSSLEATGEAKESDGPTESQTDR
jgi:hypothetical protein